VILETAGVLIAGGGLYDLLTPKLPSNLASICSGNARVEKLMRELLRALGGALLAIGGTLSALIGFCGRPPSHAVLIIALILVLPSEGVNAVEMYRVGSPYQIPLGFVALTIIGVLLSWPHAAH
jgi:uncharacterized membrane protein